MGLCGGVCCADQSRRSSAGGPHMFTGSIPPVEAQLGRRSGAGSNRIRSHLTPAFSPVFSSYLAVAQNNNNKQQTT